MAVIGIALNDVLRAYTERILYIHNRYTDETFSLEKKDVISDNWVSNLNLKDLDELNDFLYNKAPLEIFGHASEVKNGLINELNLFLMDIDYEEEHEVVLISKEVGKSIPASLFFLSKLGCKVANIKFVAKEVDSWNFVDILITASSTSLDNKPTDKISIKINTPYNTNCVSDYSLDTISEFFKDENLRNKIISNKIAEFEEI